MPDVTNAATESAAQEAHRLTTRDRQSSYGHPLDDFTRTGRLWAPVLEAWKNSPEGTPVPPELVALCMVQVKVSREVHMPKRDNRTDGCGYFNCLDLLVTERERREAEALAVAGTYVSLFPHRHSSSDDFKGVLHKVPGVRKEVHP